MTERRFPPRGHRFLNESIKKNVSANWTQCALIQIKLEAGK